MKKYAESGIFAENMSVTIYSRIDVGHFLRAFHAQAVRRLEVFIVIIFSCLSFATRKSSREVSFQR